MGLVNFVLVFQRILRFKSNRRMHYVCGIIVIQHIVIIEVAYTFKISVMLNFCASVGT